jgi:isocitrate/isopropylmalate dehydrogenase
VDILSLGFFKNSEHSDVMVVTSNLFEDVITDIESCWGVA